MSLVTALGFIAASLATLAFLPQVLKTWRTRDAGDLSLGTYGLLAVGVALWLVYGLLIGDGPLVASNAVTLVLVLSVLAMALAFRR